MESTVDPSQAGEGKQIKGQDGLPTSDIVSFRTLLRASHENGQLTLEGTIKHGDEITRLTMKKI